MDPATPAIAFPIADVQGYLRQVFAWMFVALAITTGTAIYLDVTGQAFDYFSANPNAMWILFAAQVGLALFIQWVVHRLSAAVAIFLFCLYSVLIGVTFAVLLAVYTPASIVGACAGATGVFAGMAVYGYTTKRDLSGYGGLLFGGFIGVFFASIVYAFTGGEVFNLIIGWVGVLVFSGLTAWDMQRLKEIGSQPFSSDAEMHKAAIVGALVLYINFINLVISLLRIFGNRN